MRNLKKVLALGLALIMMLSMMSFASAAEAEKLVATELSDWDSVANKDAVAISVDLEIIKGRSDGSYDPTANIIRSEWAKMVYVALTGSDDADAYKGASPFPDVVSNHWALGHISYLKTLGVVAGDTAGNFNPNNNVKVVEAAKMLLTGLGYDAEKEGFQNNANWATNIMRAAKKLGIINGVTQTQQELLTRDNAALMVYNTLQANVVEPEYDRDMGEWYVKSYEEQGTLAEEVFGIKKVTAVVESVDADGNATLSWAKAADATVTITGAKASLNDVKRTVTVWISTDDETAAFSSQVAATAVAPMATVTKGGTIASLVNTTSASAAASAGKVFAEDTLTYIENGVVKAEYRDTELAAGTVVEFYNTNSTPGADIVKIYTWDVGVIGEDAVEVQDDGTIDIAGIGTGYYKAEGTDGLAEDDVVLYYTATIDSKSVIVLKKAASVVGKVTAKAGNNTTVTVGGTKYAASKLTGASDVVAAIATWDTVGEKNNEYRFYLDDAGNVVAIVSTATGSSSTTSTSEVAYVIATGTATTAGGTDALGNATAGSSEYRARLLFTDGTTDVVKVIVYKTAGASSVTYNVDPGDDETELTDTVWGTTLTNIGTLKTAANQVVANYIPVKATETSDGYKLEEIASPVTNSSVSITPSIKYDGTHTADTATKFLIEKTSSSGNSYTTTVGFKNLPKLTAASVIEVTVSNVKYVLLSNNGAVDGTQSSDEYVFVTSASYSVNVDGNREYAAIGPKGQKDYTLVMTYADGTCTASVGLCKITARNASTGVVTAMAPVSSSDIKSLAAKNSVITIDASGSATYWSVDSDTEAYMVTDDQTSGSSVYSVSTVDLTGTIADSEDGLTTYTGYVVGSNELADFVVVICTKTAAEE